MHTPIIAVVAVSSLAALLGITHQQPTAPAPAAIKEPTSPLAQLEFLAGAWASNNDDGLAEEHWSKPHGTSIMGMFRWCKPSGEPAMFEILTISAEPDGVVLRLRHFSPKLVAKEDKDAPMTFKLESAAPSKAVFKASSGAGTVSEITYHSPAPDRLLVNVAFTPESNRESLKFDLRRQTAGVSGDAPPKK